MKLKLPHTSLLNCCIAFIGGISWMLFSPIPLIATSPWQVSNPVISQITIEPIESKSVKAKALTDAKYLLGEGDRTTNKAEARSKWEAAAKKYIEAGDPLGSADAYLRLANSYQIEALFSRQKLKLAVEYYLKALTASADVYEELIQKELGFDQSTLKQAQDLYIQGETVYKAGDCDKAVTLLEKAGKLFQQIKFGSGEIRVLTIKAICQMEAENYLGSLSTLLEGLLITQSLPLGEPITERYLEGQQLYDKGDLSGAQTIFQEVLTTYQERNDKEGIAEVMLDLGSVYAQQGNYIEAGKWFSDTLPLFVALDNEYSDYNEAAVRHNLGNLATIDGRYAEAHTWFHDAVKIWQAIGNPEHEVMSLSGLGLALRGEGAYPQALAILEQAREQQQHLTPNLAVEGDIRNNIGYVYHSQGKFPQALAEFEKALELRRQLPQPQRSQKEVETLNNIGAVYASTGHFAEALATYQQLLDQLPANTPSSMIASIQANVAAIYVEQSNYQKGIATYLDILPDLANQKMDAVHATALQNLGAAYIQTGKLAEGERYLLEAQTIFSATSDLPSVALIDNNLGLLSAKARKFDQANKYLESALNVSTAISNSAVTAKILNNLALVAAAQGNLPEATRYGEEALKVSENVSSGADQARIAISLGLIQLGDGNLEGALEYGQRSQAIAQQADDPLGLLGSHTLLATVYLFQNEVQSADVEIRAAITQLEDLQGSLTVADLKTAFLDQLGSVYDLAVLIALANNQPEQAFLYTEQSRARAFLDQLAHGYIDFRQNASAKLLEQEQAMRQRMVSLQKALNQERLDQQRTDAIDNLSQELESARREHSELLLQLQSADPLYADLFNAKIQSLPDVQKTLDEQSTLILYFLPDVAFLEKPLAWVIERKSAKLIELDISQSDLEAKVAFLHKQFLSPKDLNATDLDAALMPLYDGLIAPLRPYIHRSNLIIVPHATLHYLPFAALRNKADNHYLIESYTISYLPSASALPLILAAQNPNTGQLLALGNPDGSLKYAATEVQQVANLYDDNPLLGKEASESKLIAESPTADLIHIAAHGVYDTFNPLYSRIELAADSNNDGNLEVHEVFGLDLHNSNLVVLSACETALGKQSRGDELVGLTRAFFQAGAPTVITTWWSVEDLATSKLMGAFYENLHDGKTAAAALREAQLTVLAEEKWQSPYYWAAFGLNGDYRNGN